MMRAEKNLSRRWISLLLGGIILAAVSPTDCTAEELRWDAQALYGQAVTEDVRLTPQGTAIELERGELIEDDGPAAGYSYKPNQEKLSKGLWIRKQLPLTDPRTDQATLLIGGKGDFQFLVNGQPQDLQHTGQTGHYWQTSAINPEALIKGMNDFEIRGEGSLWIARDDESQQGSLSRTQHPNRSARSLDGGKTWNDRQLGTTGNVDGEYYVRLFLDRYRSRGTLLLPVFAVGNLSGNLISPPRESIGPIRVQLQAEESSQGKVTFRMRTGNTPIPSETSWSAWHQFGTAGQIEHPSGRYLQIEVTLETSDPQQSPALKEILIQADPQKSADWLEKLTVLESHNEEIIRSSIPFEYESFTHPHLQALRERYRLDEVTKGATSEWELTQRLAAWSSKRWKPIGHLGEAYPPWNALDILKSHADGTPVGGFCQQFNLVFLQACESYGLVGRAVSLGPGDGVTNLRGGHEVVEIWSNEFRKWIYIDGDHAWFMVDEETDIPLSLWELRQRQLAAFLDQPFRPVRLVRIDESGEPWDGLTSKPPFAELRLIPRSNFLAEAAPLPLNQGMRGWFWTGHHVWTDGILPASLLYSKRVSHRRNWEWTLNQARYTLEATATPGVIRVHLDTQTPHFAGYLAEIDGQQPVEIQSGFLWKLHPGKNALKAFPRNSAGREGIPSSIVLDYSP